jgi:hypothetical protein
LFGKPTPLIATISFHTIVVREQQKLTARLGGKKGVPTKLKSKLYDPGQVLSLVSLELMGRRFI